VDEMERIANKTCNKVIQSNRSWESGIAMGGRVFMVTGQKPTVSGQ